MPEARGTRTTWAEAHHDLIAALPHPLHVFADVTGGPHYHFGVFEDPEAEPIRSAQQRTSRSCARLLPAGGRVLDVGAGLGGSSVLFAERGHQTVAVDPCRASVDFARLLHPGPRFLVSRFETFADTDGPVRAPFDAIVFLESMQHLPSLSGTLDRCRRLLAPDGVVVVCDTFQYAGLPWDQVPFHTLEPFLDRLRRAGVTVSSHESMASHARTTLERFLGLLAAARPRLLQRFVGSHPQIADQVDEVRQHGEALVRAFLDGDLTFEILSLRLN